MMNAESRMIMGTVEDKLVEIEKLEVKKARLEGLKKFFVYKEEGRAYNTGKNSIKAITCMIEVYNQKIDVLMQFVASILRDIKDIDL